MPNARRHQTFKIHDCTYRLVAGYEVYKMANILIAVFLDNISKLVSSAKEELQPASSKYKLVLSKYLW